MSIQLSLLPEAAEAARSLNPNFAHDSITQAFEEMQRLEKIFNYHDPDSALSHHNRGAPACTELQTLLAMAHPLEELSEGGFSLRNEQGLVDLGGVAKGFIVDAAVELLKKSALFSGCVNAGGDLRFFHSQSRPVHLRLGSPEKPLLRSFEPPCDSLATSSFGASAAQGAQSRTTYSRPLRPPLEAFSTTAVSAPRAWMADGLTKVLLFSPTPAIQRCCDFFQLPLLLSMPQGIW